LEVLGTPKPGRERLLRVREHCIKLYERNFLTIMTGVYREVMGIRIPGGSEDVRLSTSNLW
jgi:hypothetical protein